jgi:hypothetical protein
MNEPESGTTIKEASVSAKSREDLWVTIVHGLSTKRLAEVGVYRGEFSATILDQCKDIETYYLIDPWRHLGSWNKPFNRDDAQFIKIKAEAIANTEFAKQKCIVLQGTTSEVSPKLPESSLDIAYLDGDHTLRGIAIDLIQLWPKVTDGGVIGGDDFRPNVWQHDAAFEPTFVFPYAVYFAEAMNAPIYAMPFNQFAIVKDPDSKFEFIDLTGKYSSTAVGDALKKGTEARSLLGRIRRNLFR